MSPTGVVLGKFLPPHLGHTLLIDFARHYVQDLTVLVGTLKAEPIPGALRYDWMRRLHPDVRVCHLTDENPQYPEEHPDFWQIWRDSMMAHLGTPPTYLFASEDYGAPLAEVLGSTFVPVDVGREAVPVSGTAIRERPWANWAYLPDVVRPYFVGRVRVVGPESTGKSTLAARLAQTFETRLVTEYARVHLERQGSQIAYEDMIRIARGQAALEDALALQAHRLLICDTDLRATTLWSQALFDRVDPWITAQADARRYDLTLLCDVDVPFVPDPVRYLPERRAEFMAACRQALAAEGATYVEVRGDWETRWETARGAVEALLERGRPMRLDADARQR